MRSEGSYRLRPAFPGTAVVLAGDTYEVLSETEIPEDGLVVYRMRAWPEGEVVRDRVVYGPSFVRAAEAERERARVREKARPWRSSSTRSSACCRRRSRSGSATASASTR